MPMRWTPETDQLLLLKILETHNLSVDAKKVAEAWPGTEAASKPTPRAITERLVRMRAQVRSSGTGNFTIGSGKGSAASTPRKPRASGNKSAATTPGSGKRKRSDVNTNGSANGDDDGDEDMNVETPSKKQQKPKRGHVKKESNDSEITIPDLSTIEATPSKRTRTPAACPPGMVVYQSEGEEKTIESSASEYAPEGSVGQENSYIKDLDEEMDVQDWA
ncbi:hypothetical protein Plec18167_008776 [Paecilomyces lecythidis]|uniref:Uncharacterized protein n=1 Tax=Paecilomyces lecythidis TaxID=3004212 RepID=A0ABR3WUA5_9EURO